MNEPIFLTLDEVFRIHARSLAEHGGSDGVREPGLVESALASAKNVFYYAHGDIFDVAAGYAFHLAESQAFIDGNKRTALAACLVFLEVNGLLSKRKLPLAAWESLVLDVAASRLDRNQTTRRLRKLLPRARH